MLGLKGEAGESPALPLNNKERRKMSRKIRFGIVTLVTLAILLTVLPFQEVGLAATAKETVVSNAFLSGMALFKRNKSTCKVLLALNTAVV
jgi:hypothetical protein